MSAVNIAVNLLGNDGTGAAFASMTGNVIGLTGSLGYLARMFEELGPTTMGAAVIAGTAALAFKGFFSVVEDGISAAADFEYSMVSLENALQANADEAPLLGDAVQQMAIRTVFSITDATEAFSQLVEMGFNTQEVLYGFGPATDALMDGTFHATEALDGLGNQALDLAQAMRTDATTGAQLLGATLHTFAGEGLSAKEAADLLAGAFLNGVPSAQALAQAIAGGGAAAATAGVHLSDYLAVLDILTQSGLSASSAAASLQYYIQALTAPIDKQKTELEALNLVTLGGADGYQILSSKLFDANGNFIGLAASVKLLNEALDGKTQEQRLEAIAELFNVRSGKAAKILTNVDDFEGQYNEIMGRFGQTDVSKMAEKQLNTLLGAVDAFKDTFQSTLISIFKPVEQQLAAPILKINDLIGAIGKLPDATKAGFAEFFIVGTIATGILAIVAAVATVVGILGALGVGFAAVAVPVGIAAAIIAGLILAFFGLKALWEGVIEPHMGQITGLFKMLGDTIGTVGNNLQTYFAPLLSLLGGIFAGIGMALQAVMPWLQKVGDFLGAHIKVVFDMLGDVLNGSLIPAWNNLQTALMKLWTAMQPLLPIFQAIGVVIGVVIVAALGFLLSALIGVISGIATFIAGLVSFVSGIVTVITGIITVVVGVVTTILQVIEALATGHIDQVNGILIGGWNTIMGGIGDILKGIAAMAAGIWAMTVGTVISIIVGFYHSVIDWFTSLWDALVGHSIIPDMVNGIVSWIGQLPGRVGSILAGFVIMGITKATEFRDGLINKAKEIVGQIAGVGASIISSAASALAGLASIGTNAGAGLMKNLLDAIRSKLGALKDLAGQIAGIIAGLLHHSVPDEGPLKDDDKWGGEFVDNLINGMNSRTSALKSAADLAARTLSGPFTTPNTAATAGSFSGSGTGVVVIPITMDGKQIAEYTVDIVNKTVRQSGGGRLAR